MPECDYCDASFEDEDAYLDHLAAEHEGELSRIDSRRVEQRAQEQGVDVPPTVVYGVAGLALLALLGGGIYYVVGVFTSEGMVHEHGTIELVVDDRNVDFDREPYHQPRQVGAGEGQAFHFHRGQGNAWHMHPNEPGRLTLAEAMDWLGIELTSDRLVFEGEEYDATQEGVELTVEVNGEPVDPESYELQGVESQPYDEGDEVSVEVQTGG